MVLDYDLYLPDTFRLETRLKGFSGPLKSAIYLAPVRFFYTQGAKTF